jgi:ribose transport system ATP-binding protein
VHLCDRCIVLYRGAIVAELRAEELAPELLLSMAAGHRSQVDRALLADNSANGVSV